MLILTPEQEFSIEMPDKEADAIQSGMWIFLKKKSPPLSVCIMVLSDIKQSSRRSTTFCLSPMVSNKFCSVFVSA